jgi:hypothetical protein
VVDAASGEADVAVTDLERVRRIREGLALAACSLVGAAATGRAAGLESAVMVYTEPDRVTGVESILQGRKGIGPDRALTFRLVFDTLTGASANGATPSGRVQTFTRPSGHGGYSVAAGKTPLDDTFKDTRIAGSGGIETPLGRAWRGTFGANVSSEYDYRSFGASAIVTRDFFSHNTTLSAGLSASHDIIAPVGGAPDPLSVMSPPSGGGEDEDREDEDEGGTGDHTKNVTDLLVGLTQILDRTMWLQLNYSVSHASGYQTDPYKVVSVLQTTPGGGEGEPLRYLYEKRPNARTKQSLYAEARHHFTEDILGLSYRYFWDDWGVRSHTAELRYRWQPRAAWTLEPHVRAYVQSEADFYRRFLRDDESVPAEVSADYRLGAFHAETFGLRIGHTAGAGGEVSCRVEYYVQAGDGSPPEAFGSLRGFDLFPTVDAVIAQVGYSIDLGW